MKRQFIQMQPGPSSPPPAQARPERGQDTIKAEPIAQTPTPSGKGLLSKWKAGSTRTAPASFAPSARQNTQFPDSYFQGRSTPQSEAGIIDQDTLIQKAAQSPDTGPLLHRSQAGHAQTAERVFDPAGPVSPHQSAIGLNLFARQAPSNRSQLLAAAGPISPQQSQAGIDLFATQMGAMPIQRGPASQANMSFAVAAPPTQDPRGSLQSLPGFATSPQPPGNGSGTPPQHPSRRGRHKKRRVPMWVRIAIAALLLLILIPGGIGIYYYLSILPTVSSSTGQKVVRAKGDEDPHQSQSATGDVLSSGRMNLLLLGSDTDYKTVHDLGGVLAQTLIVLTVDPGTKDVSMLSLPRDTWLNVPGYGMHKLDQAYLLGGGGAGGVALTMETIHQDFGIYIDHYAWVGLDGFVKVIDTVGGVDIDTIHPITDDLYPDDACNCARDAYAVKPLYIAPGPQHLDGQQALEYVRSRHADLIGDFGRSVRQQQILTQLKNKLNNPAIISKMTDLAKALNGHVKTDMEMTQVFQLMNFARTLDQNKIKRITLAPYSSTTAALPQYQNQSVVLLNCDQVLPVISKTFALGDQARCDLTGDAASTLSPAPQPSQNTSGQAIASDPTSATFNQLSDAASTSLQGGQNDLFGMRSLLDFLFTGVFESPDALTV
ncbi:MAG: LCP family protein [Chloroflexota bacterium]|nr:LCP family protein [Chloroflexota bacterium]